jgi:hypothetical protein
LRAAKPTRGMPTIPSYRRICDGSSQIGIVVD